MSLVVRDDSRYDGVSLPPITWSEESEDHIARHRVVPEEVQEALYMSPRWITPGRGGTTLVFAMSDAGRHLLIVIAPALDGGVYIVTARDQTDSERRTFRRKGR
ncbi:BrnT family toxin [Pengzhenrongella frigida]|uniref:BrnT family toxin n=1 Tax=Pengzhenrongella frigida TaxID=1259133 RepID=A0A4Q5MVR4_9MICO|nr:BrnT family toxin [Cellulomonas sp. HLT2-17]RYV49605.1 BrnT family toxin [Cellulomonas sp. HLT2-17]